MHSVSRHAVISEMRKKIALLTTADFQLIFELLPAYTKALSNCRLVQDVFSLLLDLRFEKYGHHGETIWVLESFTPGGILVVLQHQLQLSMIPGEKIIGSLILYSLNNKSFLFCAT